MRTNSPASSPSSFLMTWISFVSNNEYLPVEERGNIINGGTAKLHKLQP